MSDFYYTGSERNKSCCSWNKSELGRLEMVFNMLMVCLPVNQSVHSCSPEQEAVLTVTDQNVCSYDIQREQLGDPWFFTYLDSQVKLVYLTLPQRCTANYILKLLLLTSPPAPPPCQNVYLYTANQSESNLSRSWLRVLPFLVWTLMGSLRFSQSPYQQCLKWEFVNWRDTEWAKKSDGSLQEEPQGEVIEKSAYFYGLVGLSFKKTLG